MDNGEVHIRSSNLVIPNGMKNLLKIHLLFLTARGIF